MSLTPSQIKIKARLYDLLQTLHFTKARDDARADDLIIQVVKTVEQIVQGELTEKGVKHE
jgi:hypothetical protein